ncbi:MAG: hypothetical protein J0M08_07665 [Bacteroidetes bacterium]|nr:hypothetical protein [Bacteroidota bacterium]
MEKKCLECKEVIKGRIDKKFCSDLCRNSFNNRLNSDSVNYVRNVNNILRKNRRILEELVPEETAKTSKAKLSDKGFNFAYFTSTYTTKKGDTYYYCYDYGYLPLENNFYFLVKKRDLQ